MSDEKLCFRSSFLVFLIFWTFSFDDTNSNICRTLGLADQPADWLEEHLLEQFSQDVFFINDCAKHSCLQCIVLLEVKLQLKRVGCVCGIRWDPDRLLDSKFVSVGLCNKAPVNCSNAQCVLCKVYFSAQPNKLRPILKVKEYYPIEHIFDPARSSARKIHFFNF